MIDKKLFCAVINEICEDNDAQDEINSLLRRINYDGSIVVERYTATLLLLKEVMHDNENWIKWYCYDNNFGRSNCGAFYSNGKPIDLSAPEKLYDFLIENCGEKG